MIIGKLADIFQDEPVIPILSLHLIQASEDVFYAANEDCGPAK